ncbi:Hypothetical predicted protein [Paramuricea clavata]|uniref:Uncharacterized protein n=1 Tax=Paramuricea clavata TaxID=317549 RepID=A0A6S7J8D5_PARCT|nr:Hypothetical predicted protein [Paramuricea clavata]
MAKLYMALFLFGVILALTTVQSKTILNDHGEIIGETAEEDQESQATDAVNEDLDEEKRTYKPPVYYRPRFSCGNVPYSPRREVCCCGKKYTRKYSSYGPYRRLQWKCCGYQLMDGYLSKCCPYATVISKKYKCPKSKL